MKMLTAGLVTVLLAGPSPTGVGSFDAGERGVIPSLIVLSGSDTYPWDFEWGLSPPWTGEKTFYLWFINYATEEIQFGLDGTLELVSFQPAVGVLNEGSEFSPTLTFQTGCAGADAGELLLGALVVRDPDGSGGTVCFTVSQSTGRACFRLCYDAPWFELVPVDLRTAPSPLCPSIIRAPDCNPISVDPDSWGRVKASYR